MHRETDELYEQLLDRLRHALMYEQEAKRALLSALNVIAELREAEQEDENDG